MRSHTASRVITVITLMDEDTLYGVNGWLANNKDQALYRQEDQNE